MNFDDRLTVEERCKIYRKLLKLITVLYIQSFKNTLFFIKMLFKSKINPC